MTPVEQADLKALARILTSRAELGDLLSAVELRQLALMLLNISEGKGALEPRWPPLTAIKGGRDAV